MHAASGARIHLAKIEVRTFEWCLYNIDAYVCHLEIMLKWNELLFSCKVLCEFLMEAKISVFVVERRLYNFNIDAFVCNVYS